MPPKRGKERSASFVDKTPPEILGVEVLYCCSVNPPVRRRMGHVSYVHPKNGLLYVVGGCDLTTLPQALKSKHQEQFSGPMPFVEWWNKDTQTWGVGTDLPSEQLQSKETEKTREQEEIPAERIVGNVDIVKNFCSGASAPPNGVSVNKFSTAFSDSFSWPRLAASVVYWGMSPGDAGSVLGQPVLQKTTQKVDDDTENNGKAEKVGAPQSREHPVVLFIGGWTGSSRFSNAVGLDMDSGALLHFREGTLSSFPAVTSLTGSLVGDCVYLFGGNTNKGYISSSTAGKLDLANRKWCEMSGKDAPGNNPNHRSSHVAGLLLGRYIVIHGGRRQARPVVSPQKGKKMDPRLPPPIANLGLDFCTDIAVYSLEKEQWITATVNIIGQGPAPRYGHAACALSQNELLLHGGMDQNGKVLSDAWILRLYEKSEPPGLFVSWLKLMPRRDDADPLPARCNHAIAFSGRRVYITGGIGVAQNVDDVCILDIDPLPSITPSPADFRRRTIASKESTRSRAA